MPEHKDNIPDQHKPLAPVLYIPHGGGPLPLLQDKHHLGLIQFLSHITRQFVRPDAILLISAHWEAELASVTNKQNPELIYDYYGFPDAAYDIQYPAPGAPALSSQVHELITAAGIPSVLDAKRGFDHGLFVPLKLMYPDADIPCVQLSLTSNLDPAAHIALGKSLTSLRKQNILIIGSGLSFHNLNRLFSPTSASQSASEAFDNWLVDTCTSELISPKEREKHLREWQSAPSARICHPREEHLLPLHVCFGISCQETPQASLVFNELFMDAKVSAFLWR